MQKIYLVNTENQLEFLEGIEYGSNLLSYTSKESFNMLNDKIRILNEYFGGKPLVEKEAIDFQKEDGTFVYSDPTVRCVIFSKFSDKIPKLHIDNYNAEKHLDKAVECSGFSELLKIHPNLVKYYKQKALALNVKFKDGRFDATKRKVKGAKMVGYGVSTQIKEAFLNNEKSVCFSLYRTNLQSIRNAASTFGRMVGKKFKVEVHGKECFVMLQEFSENEKDSLTFKNIVLKIRDNNDKEYVTALFHEYLDYIGDGVEITKNDEVEDWFDED